MRHGTKHISAPRKRRTSENSVPAKFTEIAHLPHSPVRSACPRRGHKSLVDIIGFLCTTLHEVALSVHKERHRAGGSREKSRAALEGGTRQARLDNEIVTLCAYAANGVFFAESMCFDTSMEGNGGPSGGVPHCAKLSAAWPCPTRQEQSEGPKPSRLRKLRPHERSRSAEHVGR